MTWAEAMELAPDRRHASKRKPALFIAEGRLELMPWVVSLKSLGMDDSLHDFERLGLSNRRLQGIVLFLAGCRAILVQWRV
jgi:hypothetical protein